ncbi:MAG TPA: mechanosensitive ion channel domain-containing protein [Abditibacteriaceae bacterium]|jgi:small conductance mechanosensitive channel
MQLREALAANFNFANLILKGTYVLLIAIAFELILFIVLRRIERWVAPLLSADAGRDHGWRLRRRTILRQTPKALARTIVYGIALILVFDVFGVPVLPLSLAVGALVALTGAALLPVLRDIAQGYTLLAEDAIAVGDVIQMGNYVGTVERFTLRAVTLRDRDDKTTMLANRDVRGLTIITRKTEDISSAPSPTNSKTSSKAKDRSAVAFDPLNQ